MPHKRIALMTDTRWPELYTDDRPLIGAFQGEGLSAIPVIWTDKTVDWEFFDAVVVRTPWDYHLKLHDFEQTVQRIEASGIPLWNPASILLWNARKGYLDDLEAKGVPCIPSAWMPAGSAPLLRAMADQHGWTEVVVKPEISGGGRDTWRAKREDLEQVEEELAPKLRRAAFFMQPFVPEIETNGEISLVFFSGDFSHAVRKMPAKGGFLVHEKHGGHVDKLRADADLIRWANGVLYFVDSPLLYARVDLVETPNGPVLVELEVLEPELFFRHGPGSAEKFASALAHRLG